MYRRRRRWNPSAWATHMDAPTWNEGPATSLSTPMTEHFLGPMRRRKYLRRRNPVTLAPSRFRARTAGIGERCTSVSGAELLRKLRSNSPGEVQVGIEMLADLCPENVTPKELRQIGEITERLPDRSARRAYFALRRKRNKRGLAVDFRRNPYRRNPTYQVCFEFDLDGEHSQDEAEGIALRALERGSTTQQLRPSTPQAKGWPPEPMKNIRIKEDY